MNAKIGPNQKLPFEVYTMTGLINTSTISHNNGILLFSQNTPHQMPLLSDAAVIFLRSIAVLTANGLVLDCATIVSSERFRGLLVMIVNLSSKSNYYPGLRTLASY